MSGKQWVRAAVCCAVWGAMAAGARAAEADGGPSRWTLGAAAGPAFLGTMYVEGHDLDAGVGFTGKLHGDYWVAPRFSTGLALQATTIGTELDGTLTVLSLGPTLSAHFGDLSRVHYRATLGVTYQLSSWSPLDHGMQGLGIPFTFGVVVPSGGVRWSVEAGFISQPFGGNSDYSVTWSPMGTVLVGIETDP